MAAKLLAWEIDGNNRPRPLDGVLPDLEARLEDWIERDVSLVDPGLMLLGRQVLTSYGTRIDVLAIDSSGDLAIIELKRDRSPRDMVAQALEYAAWAAGLDYDAVLALGATVHGGDAGFRAAFGQRFSAELPEALNEGQRIYLVAPELSASVVGVTEYLSARFKVPINAVTFALYRLGDHQVLVRSTVLEEQLEPATTPKRSSRRTLEELLGIASERGTRVIVDELMKLRKLLPSIETSMTSIALKGRTPSGSYLAGISIYPSTEGEPGVIINIPHNQLEPCLASTP